MINSEEDKITLNVAELTAGSEKSINAGENWSTKNEYSSSSSPLTNAAKFAYTNSTTLVS